MMSNPRETYFEMYGRLVGVGKRNNVVKQYLGGIVECTERPSIRALNECLNERLQSLSFRSWQLGISISICIGICIGI